IYHSCYDHRAADARGARLDRHRSAATGRTGGSLGADHPADGGVGRTSPRRGRHFGQSDRRARSSRRRAYRRECAEYRHGARRPAARGAGGIAVAESFTPKLVTVLREGYGFKDLRADAVAGLTVAIVALPLA